MAATTPVKIVESHPNCFICDKSSHILFKLNERKCAQGKIPEKLELMLTVSQLRSNSEFVGLEERMRILTGATESGLNHRVALLCRNCFDKVEKFFDFIKLIDNSSFAFCEKVGLNRKKRTTLSPLTPKMNCTTGTIGIRKPETDISIANDDNMLKKPTVDIDLLTNKENIIKKNVKKTRKSLFQSKVPVAANVESQDSHTTLTVDHTYGRPIQPNANISLLDHAMEDFINHGMRYDLKYANYQDKENCKFDDKFINLILNNLICGDLPKFVENILLKKAIEFEIKRQLLKKIDEECTLLSSRNTAFNSVLARRRSIKSFSEISHEFLFEIMQELHERLPFVCDIFLTMSVASKSKPDLNLIPPLVSAYSILMHQRSVSLSSWQRMVTLITLQGQLNVTALKRLNHLGISLSAQSRLALQDEACMQNNENTRSPQGSGYVFANCIETD